MIQVEPPDFSKERPLESRSILVVDDEPTVADLVSVILERHGLRVVAARDGAEAIEAAARERFDVILLDVMLPRVDGLEVCRSLRGDLGLSDPRIVLCSAADESSIGWADAGADAFLAKPFSVRKLCDLIDRLAPEEDGQPILPSGSSSPRGRVTPSPAPPARRALRSSSESPGR